MPRPKTGVVVATLSPTKNRPGSTSAVVAALGAVDVEQRAAGQHVGHRDGALGVGPVREAGDRPGGRGERGLVPQVAQARVVERPDHDHGEQPVLVGEDQAQVAVAVGRPGDRAGHRAGLGPVAQAVDPVDVGLAARSADPGALAGRRVARPLRPEASTTRSASTDVAVDDEAGARDRRAPRRRRRGRAGARSQVSRRRPLPERALEGLAARAEAHRGRRRRAQLAGRPARRRGEPAVVRLGDLAPQGVADGLPEGVGVVELHHAASGPGGRRRRAGVAVDGRDLVPPAGQGAAEEQPGRAGADDRDPHRSPSPEDPAPECAASSPRASMR